MDLYKVDTELTIYGDTWTVFAEDSKGRLLPMGTTPKLTLGEKLFGKYRRFFAVNLEPPRYATTITTASAIGQRKFTVNLKIRFVVADPHRVIKLKGDLEEGLIEPLRSAINQVTRKHELKDFALAADEVNDLNSSAAAKSAISPAFKLLSFEADVVPPKGTVLEAEMLDDIRSLELQLTAAVFRGDKDLERNYRAALAVMKELSREKGKAANEDHQSKLINLHDTIKLLADIDEQKSRMNATSDSAIMAAAAAQQKALLLQLNRSLGIADGDVPKPDDGPKPPHDKPKDSN